VRGREHCFIRSQIPDVPDDVVAALEARARRLGLSRSEYVRRRLAQEAAVADSPVSVGDLARFAETFSDLADPDVMSQAWECSTGCPDPVRGPRSLPPSGNAARRRNLL
jgi:Ribbon-helix-helix protein, copG family